MGSLRAAGSGNANATLHGPHWLFCFIAWLSPSVLSSKQHKIPFYLLSCRQHGIIVQPRQTKNWRVALLLQQGLQAQHGSWWHAHPLPDRHQETRLGDADERQRRREPKWSTNTWFNNDAFLSIQDECNLVAHSLAGKPLWESGTFRPKHTRYQGILKWVEGKRNNCGLSSWFPQTLNSCQNICSFIYNLSNKLWFQPNEVESFDHLRTITIQFPKVEYHF